MVKSCFHPRSFVESRRVGKGTRVWAFAHVMEKAVVGEDCNVGEHCFIENGARIGDRVTVKNGVAVWEGVTIEDDVFVGPNAVFTNELLPVSRKPKRPFEKTRVKKGACVGANATIVCGAVIGRYAFVGAGAVVTADVPDYGLVYGNPARPRGFLCACRARLRFKSRSARCACGRRYHKASGRVQPV